MSGIRSKSAVNVLVKSLKPSDTHCASGETCMSAKYCPKGDNYVNGKCTVSGVSSGVSYNPSSFPKNGNDRESNVTQVFNSQTYNGSGIMIRYADYDAYLASIK